MMFAQPRLTTLGQVETVLGQHLIRMEVLRIQIETLRHTVDRERWQERLAALAVFALIGAVIGCVTLFSAVGK